MSTEENKNRDAYIDVINDIVPHENADRLEIARVRNWNCVIGKGDFKVGERVIFIQPDAVIESSNNHVGWDFSWRENIARYLGSKGRVRTVRLRGEASYGLLIKLTEDIVQTIVHNYRILYKIGGFDDFTDTVLKQFKMSIEPVFKWLDENLENCLAIKHYEAPVPQDISCKRIGLPEGVEKSDETNYQSLSDNELHLGENVLVTRKMDGSSATLYYDPGNDILSMHSRSMELKPECDNDFTIAMRPLVDIVKQLGRYFCEPIALRGEVCCAGRQSSKVNKDAVGAPTFFMYGVRFPKNEDKNIRYGYLSSGRHFTDIARIAHDEFLFDIRTVPVLGYATLSKDVLKAWADAPASDGEGVVVNGETFSYKIRSAEYDSKL